MRVLFFAVLCAALTLSLPAAPSHAASYPVQKYMNMTGVAYLSTSPDGARIAYTSQLGGNWELWVVNADGSHPRQITNIADGVDWASWVPGSPHTILYTSSHGGSGADQFYYTRDDRPGSVALLPNETKVTHSFGVFSPDGSKIAYSSNLRTEQDFDVYVLDRSTGKTRRVYTTEGTANATSWSSDGKHLLVQHVINPYNADLYTVDLQTGASRLITPHTGDANFDSSRFAPDMRSVICITDLHREFHTIERIDLATLAMHPVIDIPHDIDDFALSPGGRRMAYIVNREGYGDVVVADGSGKTLGEPSLPAYIAESPVFTNDGRVLLFNATGPTFPKVPWSYDLQSHKTARLLQPNFNGIPPDSLVESPLVHVRSFDGTMVPAFYFRPKHHSGKLTVVLDIHGGPELQDRVWFYAFAQFLASRGIALLDPNIRGSSGYGRTYLHAADGRKREDAVKDVAALRQWLVTSGGADPKSIFVNGASYGGYIVLSSLYNYPYAYAGGIDVYGVADWIDFLEKTGENRASREAIYGSLAHDRAFLASISPINHVSRIKRPVLIVHGANDTTVPVAQSKRIAATLQRDGVPVELHILPNEGHGIAHVEDLVSIYKWTLSFMQRYGHH